VPSVTWIDECPQALHDRPWVSTLGDEQAGVGVRQVEIAQALGQPRPFYCWPKVKPIPVGVANESTSLRRECGR